MHIVLNTEIKRKRRYRKKTLSQEIRIGSITLTFTLIVIICVLSIAHLLESNQFQTYGYEINELEKTRANLLIENRSLQLQIAQAKSLDSIKNSTVVGAMIPVTNAKTIKIQNEVALR